MTGIDRRIARGEQRQQRRLRPLQVECDLEVAAGGDVSNLIVPGLARILSEFLLRFAHQHVERAFDVGRREWFSIVPFYALPQLEAQRLFVAAPAPALCEIRNDRVQTVLCDILFVDDEIVEHRHERHVGRVGGLLVNRGAARAIPVVDPEDSALLLACMRDLRDCQQ